MKAIEALRMLVELVLVTVGLVLVSMHTGSGLFLREPGTILIVIGLTWGLVLYLTIPISSTAYSFIGFVCAVMIVIMGAAATMYM